MSPRIQPTRPATRAAPPPRRIEILAFDRVQLLDVAGPLQVFATVNDQLADRGEPPAYAPVVVAQTREIASSAGLALVAQPLPDPQAPLDTLLVAGGFGVNAACEGPLPAWILARATRARRTASVCSGAFLLATAGLLDGRRAVTHWHRCAEFAEKFPQVRLDPDPIFVRDGPVWTSAGITAGIDLALALVEEDLGPVPALAAARHLVVFLKRPGGQSQFSTALALQQRGDGRFGALHAFMEAHLDGDLSVAALAGAAGMSERSFVRHYRSATGETPARAVERLRIEAARRMLESGLAVKQVAARCGFGAEETLRRAFQRMLGTSPQAYRARFSLEREPAGHEARPAAVSRGPEVSA
ncbi:helix-turn-helix domain-containing protein [Rhodoplanes sp. TEM]|uniref:Helix-turn-helix domain-containing protein n=1 Tax=Rhodoplanes tepidamans TaxID=200616 RepID=A0ABT5JH69_RHOTP|nr:MULTISPECIES: helix-turn-helix domain-containing protein [Rhodoplanes]MDC7789060.1 helix-turn-helix domain-containing protein [Rhodoplanes tepidamans]MDC7982485.1 helix-turn-helix domain-containing protein [Rhodoplanes sp. TEM]MDQ0354943.1 transcriptional regulator GlxA family with amidase domain [Rhodoplanes tepidamans]